jgi:hypothetical protein
MTMHRCRHTATCRFLDAGDISGISIPPPNEFGNTITIFCILKPTISLMRFFNCHDV